VQPHACDTQTGPGLHVFEQLLHVAPDPHLSFAVPGAHVPFVLPFGIAQHPPLHVCVALHAVVHVLVVVLQACPVGQSVAELQPHLPFDRHAVPALAPVQLTHCEPGAPQAPCVLPAWHVPVPPLIWQHPPLHVCEAVHVVEHVCVVVLQALPLGQSALELQPHVRFARHAWPAVLWVQSTHAVPGPPHAVLPVPG
jgi:hypothetical protein